MKTANKKCSGTWFCAMYGTFCLGRVKCKEYVELKTIRKDGSCSWCLHQEALDEHFPEGCKRCPERFECWTE